LDWFEADGGLVNRTTVMTTWVRCDPFWYWLTLVVLEVAVNQGRRSWGVGVLTP